MNIAVNARVLLTSRMEGVCRYIYETTRRMVLSHPEDQFYFFFDRPYDEELIFADNVHPIVISPPARDPILWNIWFDWRIPKYLDRFKIDVFYSGDTYLSLKTQVPTLLVSHDLAYIHFPDHIPKRTLKYYQSRFPRFHKRADHIVAVSNFTKNDIIKSLGIDEEKISIGYNDCPQGFRPISEDEKQVIRKRYADGSPYLIYLGSIHPRKNTGRLIEAFSHLKTKRNDDLKLLIIGRKAWNHKEIMDVYNQSDFKEDIRFLGAMEKGVEDILASAEALVYISLFEGFGIPVLEAFSCGVPVVTSKGTSMEEIAGEAAVLVDPHEVEDISNGMERVLSKDDLKVTLIRKGYERLQQFSWDKTADHIYEKLKEMHTSA